MSEPEQKADTEEAEQEARRICAEFTAKLVGFARRCEPIMSHDAIAEAMVLAIVLYLRERATEPEALTFLRSIADDLEASAQAPTVN